MAEIKKVNDQYKIKAPSIVIDGNLTVMGSTTSVETVNSTVNDNIIVINSGEVGAGITAGSAGIQIDRGSSDDATVLYNETADVFEFKVGASYAKIRADTPSGANDVATKGYVDAGIVASSAAEPQWSVQYNDTGAFSGDAGLTYDETKLTVKDIEITTGSISSTTTNGDLEIAANGTGSLYLRSVLKMENEASDPSSTAGSNKVYAKTPNSGGSGLYFVNTTASDELVSKARAIMFGLIF